MSRIQSIVLDTGVEMMNIFRAKRMMMSVVFVAIFWLTACGDVPLAVPEVEQVAQPLATRRPTPTARVTQGPISPLATPTDPTITPITGPSPTVELTPTNVPSGRQFVAEKIRFTPANIKLDVLSQSSQSEILVYNWSNDGNQFAFLNGSEELIDPTPPEGTGNTYTISEVWLANENGTNTRKIIDRMGYQLLWSPNDTKIVYFKPIGVFSRELWIYDLKINTSVKLLEPPNIRINISDQYGSVAWFNNNQLIYATYSQSGKRHLWLHNVRTNKIDEILVDTNLGTTWGNFWLAPNKSFLIVTTPNALWLGELVNEIGQLKLNAIRPIISENSVIPAWSPDGTKIAIMSHSLHAKILRIIEIDSGDMLEVPFDLQVAKVEWTPDSQVLIVSSFASGNSDVNDIYAVNAIGANRILLTSSSSNDFRLSPNGKYIQLKPVLQDPANNKVNIFNVEVN